MLPRIYEKNLDVSGWLVSEKLDGVRGYWDGRKLISKNGHPFYPPAEFLKNFPEFPLEGELWGGRGTFEKTVSAVRKQQPHNGWLDLRFAVFDVPIAAIHFDERLDKAQKWFADHPSEYVFIIPQKIIANKDELDLELRRIETMGGEGVIVRKPDAFYQAGRRSDILKVKSYRDMEATVVALSPGAGRNEGRMGSLLVEMKNGIRFKIGTGFTDLQRENPPPVGSVVTFKYYGLYKTGIPKFPTFLRIRDGF